VSISELGTKLWSQLSAAELDAWVASLDANANEFFQERAGILEFDAGLSRLEAERAAYRQTLDWLQSRRS
jgi:hypothetical protein